MANELITAIQIGDDVFSIDFSQHDHDDRYPIISGDGENSAVQKGSNNVASGTFSVAIGADNVFGNINNVPEGDKLEYAKATGYASHAEGAAHALGDYSHAEGGGNTDLSGYKIVSTAEGECSHAEGSHTHAKGGSSHAEGNRSKASGSASHAEGRQTIAEGSVSHAEGFNTKTGGTTNENNREAGDLTDSGAYAHAEGNATIAKGVSSHSEGRKTIAIGNAAHAEGQDTVAEGYRSHAEGKSVKAIGRSSHAEGEYTIANNIAEHASGKYNISNSDTQFSIGIGTSNTNRKNAFEVKQNGDIYIEGVEGKIQDKLNIASVLQYHGITTTALTDGATTNPITLNGEDHTPETGCVVFYGNKEYIWNGSAWEEFGYPFVLNVAKPTLLGGVKPWFYSTLSSTGTATNLNRRANVNLASSVDGRYYGVEMDVNGRMYVNVPWKDSMINVTYAELKALRDNAELSAGQQYRITDYVTTTTQENTTSAGYQFDIIVTADSESTLNEKARACLNENDVYFSNSNAKLEAWQIWYCLDNDNNRFAWADDTSGESIIATIKPSAGVSASGTYTYDTPISKVVYNGVTYNPEIGVRTMINSGPPIYITKTDAYTLVVEDPSTYLVANGLYVYGISQVGKGVIYNMIDEYGNECPYDFKNIIFQNKIVPGASVGLDVYTFTWVDEDYNVIDASVFGNDGTLTYYGSVYGVYNNVIKPYMVDNSRRIQELNDITFISDASYEESGNEGFLGCNNNSFGYDSSNNSFGNGCSYNSFGNNCSYNSFGNNCNTISFGNNCNNNYFENNCNNNHFENNCNNNHFENNCNNNSFVIDDFRAVLFNDQSSVREISETNE